MLYVHWIQSKTNQLIHQLSDELKKFLKEGELSKENIQSIIIHGPFASAAFIQEVFLDIKDQVQNNIFLDPDGRIALNGLLQFSKRIPKENDAETKLIEMPSFIKNVTVNNLKS